MDTPAGRARDAAAWHFPGDWSVSGETYSAPALRRGFKEGAAWSRTAALHDLTVAEVDLLAEAMHDGTRPPDTKPWAELSEKTRSRWRTDAHTYLSLFLTGRRAEG